MGKLILKGIIILGLALAIIFIARALMPPFWCGPVIANKYRVYDTNKDKYNILFLGTSRINHGISPKAFDNQVADLSKFKSTSFNYGLAGASVGEIFSIYRSILKDPSYKLKYILMELPSVGTALGDKFCIENLHTNRNKYWMDTKALRSSIANVNGFIRSDGAALNKTRFYKNYIMNTFANFLSAGMMEGYLEYFHGYEIEKGLGPRLDGYDNITLLTKDKGVQEARAGFLRAGSKFVKAKKERSIEFFSERVNISDFNEQYLQQILELIRLGEDAGIHLILMSPPLMTTPSYKELAPIFFRIPEKNRINLCDAKRYPALYENENIWDGNHLNHKGAVKFSKFAAKAFVNKLKKGKKKGKK